jgi:uncharacterized membrane protein YedE/YeeE
MKKKFSRHWPYLITGPVLSFMLILFWYFNQNYLSQDKTAAVLLLENPVLTFGLIIFGSFISAFIFGEFGLKTPLTYEPLVFSLLGGFLMGVGATVAAMSVHSAVLFNLAGIFNLTAFMITKGWIYAGSMVLGGFLGSKLLIYLTLKTKYLKKDFFIPRAFTLKRNQRIIFYLLICLYVFLILAILLFSKLDFKGRISFILASMLLIIFGAITERGTICMSSMLKEWFIAASGYVWRNILFTIMCLAFFYQAGLRLSLYQPIVLEKYIQNPNLLIFGSVLMGFGFIFADGCFIGSLWKAGQGNVINMIGILGMLVGIGLSQLSISKVTASLKISNVPNHLDAIMPPLMFLALLWIAGILLFLIFKPKHYRY